MIYESTEEFERAREEISSHMMEQGARMAGLEIKSAKLVEKARSLVILLEDAENHDGGLIGTKTLRAKNELRLELSKW